MVTAGLVFVLTLLMLGGLLAVGMAIWVPQVKAGSDPRKSIAETLSATIASSGLDAAVKQYHDLKAAAPGTYNFDEGQLNGLGYRLIPLDVYFVHLKHRLHDPVGFRGILVLQHSAQR